MNFFKNIFTFNSSKKLVSNKNDEMTRLYFDRNKRSYAEIKLTRELNCQDVHSQYHNEILAELMRNNRDSTGNGSNKILNANEFNFMIIDDDNIYTEIKLKLKDTPYKFIKKKSINLYYLNTSVSKKEENVSSFMTESKNEPRSRSITMSNNDECIREGELQKYSFKHKKFDKRTLVLDKEKLIITKPKNKGKIYCMINYRINYTSFS